METRSRFSCVWKSSVLRSVVATVAAMSLLVSGCVSMQNVPLPEGERLSQTLDVKAGDEVEVDTRDGKTLSFTVTAVEAEELIGNMEPTDTEVKLGIGEATGTEVRVRYQDIASLRIQHLDMARTLRVGLKAVGVVLLLAALLVIEGLSCGCFRSDACTFQTHRRSI